MKRAAIERSRTLHRWSAHKRLGDRRGHAPVLAVGRFRKGTRMGGCRNARCWLCHADKIMSEPTPRDLRALAGYREAMRDITAHGARIRHS